MSYVLSDPEQHLSTSVGGGESIVDVQIRAVIVILGFQNSKSYWSIILYSYICICAVALTTP